MQSFKWIFSYFVVASSQSLASSHLSQASISFLRLFELYDHRESTILCSDLTDDHKRLV